MKGIFEQIQEGNVVEYKPFTIQEFTEVIDGLFYKVTATKNVRILTGLMAGFALDCAIQIQDFHYIETYKRIYGPVQISLGSKHSLNKIVVNLSKDGIFKVIKEGKEITRVNTLKEALSKYE
jgi:hypothetical protein